MTEIVFRNPRPVLTIEVTGGKKLGRCYHETTYRFTSTHKLKREMVLNLVAALGIGGNAGTDIRGGEEEAGRDSVPATEVNPDTGEVVSTEPKMPEGGIHTWSPPYYVADVAIRIDSGD